MAAEFAGANVVVVAGQFNPSIISQLWLVENDLVKRDDFEAGCLFSSDAVSVKTRRFDLVAIPPQLQFAPKTSPPEDAQVVASVLGGIVGLLPHTPYRAIGLNFMWNVLPEGRGVGDATRALFSVPGSRLYAEFGSPDSRFGAYLSKDLFGGRLKLDIKPTISAEGERILFSFNFHRDLSESSATSERLAAIHEMLSHWDNARREAERLLNLAN